jgi:hypothetical protein
MTVCAEFWGGTVPLSGTVRVTLDKARLEGGQRHVASEDEDWWDNFAATPLDRDRVPPYHPAPCSRPPAVGSRRGAHSSVPA